MSATETQVCNSALIKLGASRILSLEDDSKEARLCKEMFPRLRDELLYAHPWNFAIKRQELAKTANTPVFDFDSEFQLPNDLLRVLTTDLPVNELYAIEGDKFLTNSSSVKIRFIFRQTDVSKWSAGFREVMSFRLAADLAYPLVQSVNLSNKMHKLFRLQLSQARSFDAQEGFSQNQVDASSWINERFF